MLAKTDHIHVMADSAVLQLIHKMLLWGESKMYPQPPEALVVKSYLQLVELFRVGSLGGV